VTPIRVDPAVEAGGLESVLGRVLQVGTYVSIGLVAVGVVLLIGGGGSPLDPGLPFDLTRLPADLIALRAEGFLWLGIVGVVATPGLRVVGALIGFARRGERTMVIVAFLILVVVALGVIAGLVTG
jgi:uncharacterized membrane protein